MADPISAMLVSAGMTSATAATVTTALGYAATGFSALSTISGIQSAKAQSASEQATANYNAEMAERQASVANEQTAQAVKDTQRKNYLMKSENINNAGSVTGNVNDILSDNAAQSEMDILNIKYNGLLSQNSYLNEANLEKSKSANAKSAGQQGVASALLGGVTNTLMTANNMGLFSKGAATTAGKK